MLGFYKQIVSGKLAINTCVWRKVVTSCKHSCWFPTNKFVCCRSAACWRLACYKHMCFIKGRGCTFLLQIIIYCGIFFLCQFCIFSSPGHGPKVQVNYCHQLASVVHKLFTFQASSPKPLGQCEPSLAGMFLGWSSIKFLFFVPVGYSTEPIICSDWLIFQRSSSLKLIMN